MAQHIDANIGYRFERLHPDSIRNEQEIRSLLEALAKAGAELRRGMNRRIEPERAWIESVEPHSLTLRIRGFESTRGDAVFLNGILKGQPYFFACPIVGHLPDSRIRARFPAVIYLTERRDRARVHGEALPPELGMVRYHDSSFPCRIENTSPGGLGLLLETDRSPEAGAVLQVCLTRGAQSGQPILGRVRHCAPTNRPGWVRVGLALDVWPRGTPVSIERRANILAATPLERAWQAAGAWSSVTRAASRRAIGRLGRSRRPDLSPRIVKFPDDRGHTIVGIVDSCGHTRGAPAVIIPPAWGKTKETLLPLARTLVETFDRANRPLTVLRIDGINKRGESYRDPLARENGCEHHRFTFSQGVRDIQAALDFLANAEEFAPSKTILITFSAASVDGRRAVADDGGSRLGGWISVVGTADYQSMMRVISGGIDYAGGVERGVSFGLQEVLGVTVDMDHATKDVIDQQMAFIHDSRRDFSRITVPVIWIHGRYDAWMNLDRVQDVMSYGDTTHRSVLEVPTGHQLKSSRQAIECFQLITRAASTILVGKPVAPVWPDLIRLEQRTKAERARLKRPAVDLRAFWHDYLLGRDGRLGIDVMTSAKAYRELMQMQVRALEVCDGLRVLDAGAGTGTFPLFLATLASPSFSETVDVDGLDFVAPGLRKAQQSLKSTGTSERVRFNPVECNLDIGSLAGSVPLQGDVYDRVLASLLLSYVREPLKVLTELRRVMKPGGILVVSTLRRDADISRLYRDAAEELLSGEGTAVLGLQGEEEVRDSLRSFLNDAARLLDFEERGSFQFWEPRDLEELLRAAGFSNLKVQLSFGTPPQALVASARR